MDKTKYYFLGFSLLIHLLVGFLLKNSVPIKIKKEDTVFINLYDQFLEDSKKNHEKIPDKNSKKAKKSTENKKEVIKTYETLPQQIESKELTEIIEEVVEKEKNKEVVKIDAKETEKTQESIHEIKVLPLETKIIENPKEDNALTLVAKKSESYNNYEEAKEKKIETVDIIASLEVNEIIGESKDFYLEKIKKILTDKKKYPEIAKRMKKQGEVAFELTINNEGKIDKIDLVKSSGHKILDDSTLEVLGTIKILPKPPKGIGKINFSYKYELIK